MNDIYFDENYGKLYEKVENGEAVVFECKTSNGVIINQFIKREIPIKFDDNVYYDIVTPYGYGGPYIKECINKDALLKDYEEQFSKYCIENNIVAEFVRFHPIYKNYEDFKEIYNAKFNRYTLATNLKDYENPVEAEFSKSCRKTIRQVLKEGISFEMEVNPTDLNEFKRIYYLNMERKQADDYYFFGDEYFDNILKYYSKNIVLAKSMYDNRIVAAGLYYITDGNIHAHLSGTDTQYLHLSPAYILKYGTALWGKENGYNYIHYGGGTTTSLEDTLFVFKSKFAKNTKLEFWIGKRIWNYDVYDKLCKEKGVNKEIEYFPAYRKEV